MGSEPIWTQRGEADLLREYSRLEGGNEQKADRLLSVVDSAVRLLRTNPRMAPVYAGKIRRLVLRIPNYGLFYVAESRGIVIHGVCNLRQTRETIWRHLEISEEI